MSLKPTMQTKKYELIPSGTHLAILVTIADLGMQSHVWNGEEKLRSRLYFTWELPNETREFDGVSKPMVIGSEFTNSMAEKAKLRPIIEGMLGTKLRDDEASNFDLDSYKELLGKPCLVTVVHNESKGKTYANVTTTSPIMKGMVVPKQFNQSVVYEIESGSELDFQQLPEFIQKKIQNAGKYQHSELSDENRKALERIHAGDNKVKSQEIEDEFNIPF